MYETKSPRSEDSLDKGHTDVKIIKSTAFTFEACIHGFDIAMANQLISK